MIKCPRCENLVRREENICPHCRFNLHQYRLEAGSSPAATIALTPEQMKSLATPRACPGCGELVLMESRSCPHCGLEISPLKASPERSDLGSATAAGSRSSTARLAYYLGLVSFLPLFPVGLAALFFGIIGVGEARQIGDRQGRRRAWVGILLGGVFGFVWTLLTLWLVVKAP